MITSVRVDTQLLLFCLTCTREIDLFYSQHALIERNLLDLTNLCVCFFQNKEGGDSDSEDEKEKLEELETMLREYDPEFEG